MYYFTYSTKGYGEALITNTDKQKAEIRRYELKNLGFKCSIVYQTKTDEIFCDGDCSNCRLEKTDGCYCPISINKL